MNATEIAVGPGATGEAIHVTRGDIEAPELISTSNDCGRDASSTIAAAARVAKSIRAAWKRRRAYRKTVASLEQLNDHTLEDIGIHRSQIGSMAGAIVDAPHLDHRRNLRA